MKKHRIASLAIAGLTSVAVAITPVAVPDNSVLSAAVAQAQEQTVSFTSGPGEIKLGQNATFTVSVPNSTGGSVQFFLDNVPQGGPVKINNDTASVRISPKSYLNHTVTARYVDADGFNPRADVTRDFNTPLDIPLEVKGNGNAADGDRYSSTVNGRTGTTSNPVIVQPDAALTVVGNMELNSRSVVYDFGFNPAAEAKFISGRSLEPAKTDVKAKGNWPDSGISVNPGFFAIDVNPGWLSFGYTGTQKLEGKFNAPTVPGVYVTQLATYKYRTKATYFMRRLDDSVYRVVAPKLPDRNVRGASIVKLVENQEFLQREPGTLTAEVTPADVKGTVVFKHNGEEIASAPVENGKAVAENVTFDEAGQLPITVEFTSTTEGASNAMGAGSVNVKAVAVPTTLKLDVPAEAEIDESVKLTATVDPVAEGTVEFFDGDTSLGEKPVDNGTATLDQTFTDAGERTIKAVFTPTDAEKFEASEATASLTVKEKPTPEPEPEEPTTEPSPEPEEPTTEPTEPEDPTTEPTEPTEPEDPTTEPSPEPSPEPEEPTTEPTTEPTPEPSPEPEDPTTEPTPEPEEPEEPTPDNETYEPEAKKDLSEIDAKDGVPAPLDFVDNADELPGGTAYEWKKKPDLNKTGDQDLVIEVTYPDGTKDELKITVPVKARPTQEPTPTTPTTTTQAPPTKEPEPDKGSSGSSEKDDEGGSSQSTALKVVLGILFSLLGLGGGFALWQAFMGGFR